MLYFGGNGEFDSLMQFSGWGEVCAVGSAT